MQEVQKELQKLQQLKSYIESKLEENKKILEEIKKEQKDLYTLKENIQKQITEIQKERYKKLAKDFENMEPEYAGEKLSKFDDPKIAAYILYNMKSRKAGDALNYTDAKMVNEITKTLTKLKLLNEKK
jgi:flagellar motility protein MotE (MotC chaperone)